MALRRRKSPGDNRPKRTHTHVAHWLHDDRFWIIVAIGLLILLMAIVLWTGTQQAGTRPPTIRPYWPY
jgi:hypothetical protein